jgi:MFS transporter, MHS family, proline/betaine transporter
MTKLTASKGTEMGASSTRVGQRGPKWNATIAMIGNAIEWFDFTIFGFFAIAISRVFFSSEDPVTGLIAAFGTFGVGFIARPVGAVIFGKIGDRRGRRIVLVSSISLMAAASLIMGLAPSYAAVGLLGPVILVFGRLLQGLSAGAEFGTSVAYLIECAPKSKRGLYGSLQQVGACIGLIVGALVGALINSYMSMETILAWGWRIPFLLGSGLAVIGMLLRMKLDESPEYEAIGTSASAVDKPPVLKPCLQTAGVCALWTVAIYASVIYLPTFATQQGKLPNSLALWGTVISSLFVLPAVVLGGWMTDKYGVKRMLMIPVVGYLIMAIPGFSIMAEVSVFSSALPMMITFAILAGFISGVGPSAVGGLFPAANRTTWVSIASAIPVAIFGGFAPFFSELLIKATHWAPAPSLYIIGMAIVTGITALTLPGRAIAIDGLSGSGDARRKIEVV